ncbi:hypothetical protein PVK06_017141 [Gossypium arboreum]|uniref:Uncharacterized protein n=1 Tax=Gossypium arboreum TaxID=29729 RepID=A0ABR0Q327_GOSAR|nr:hypothetical protein PVK06_017141 [Gossypium arboreum]
MQSRNQALEKENQGLKTKVAELGRSLHHHRSYNLTNELKASLNKIEEMKHDIRRLEAALQDVSYGLSSSRQEKNSGRENFTIFKIKLEIGIISWEKP